MCRVCVKNGLKIKITKNNGVFFLMTHSTSNSRLLFEYSVVYLLREKEGTKIL